MGGIVNEFSVRIIRTGSMNAVVNVVIGQRLFDLLCLWS